MRRNLLLISLAAGLLVAVLTDGLYAQSKADSGATRVRLTGAQKPVKETVLETIYIEAEVEKPRVALLPKRVQPKLGDIEFVDRSFRRELKKLPSGDLLLNSSLFKPRKIRPARELFARK